MYLMLYGALHKKAKPRLYEFHYFLFCPESVPIF